uniref:Uncharacterized protein AlNc14C22G2244 n=1 Tax=Albugo laibachii Nc14 TaxID=890382 RepID=F0W5S9_9STRA|nr:conserved hypothetical protein [Albugo laibachii Nc14]|eukprot:CCA16470.1 conserved hypothetical protein [Albugo laibachii Nc14]
MLKMLWKWTLLAALLSNDAVAKDVSPSEDSKTASGKHMSDEKMMINLQKSRDEVRKLQESNDACAKALEDSFSEHNLKSLQFEKRISEQEEEHVKVREQLESAKKEIAQCDAKYNNQNQVVLKVEKQLVSKQDKITKCGTQVSEIQKKLKKEENMARRLERDIKMSAKRNEALKYELDHQGDKLTLAALLSAYYDQGMDAAEWLAKKTQDWLQSDQNFITSTSRYLGTIQSSISKTSRVFYEKHLAETVDPITSKIYRFLQPHYKAVAPRIEAFSAKAQHQAKEALTLAIEGIKMFRVRAIETLLLHEHIAPHARLIVDGSLALMVIPLTIFFLRYLFRCIWWFLRGFVNVCLCCVCCGRRGKKRNPPKRKQLRPAKLAQNTSARRQVAKKNN